MSSRIIIHQLILKLLVVAGEAVEGLDEKSLVVENDFSPAVSSLDLVHVARDHGEGE